MDTIASPMWRTDDHERIRVLTWNGQRPGEPVDWRQLGQLLIDQPQARWVVDLSPIPLVTSEGLAQIMGAVRRVREAGGRVALCGLSPALRQVAASVRLDRLVDILPDVTAAVAALHR